MNSSKTVVLTLVIATVACVLVALALVHRQGMRQVIAPTEPEAGLVMAERSLRPIVTPRPMAPGPSPSEDTTPPVNTAASLEPPRPTAANPTPAPGSKASADSLFKYNGYEVQDPTARLALYFVGSDPEATAYWMSAINDPSLPAEERKDLIEDLNEDGFPDPRHPSPADLPLIEDRIELIQELAPYSVDQVNRDAFAEAYKDLVGMSYGQAPH